MKCASRKYGFTLIELLVVVAIISLLSTIVLTSVQDARDRARIQALAGSVRQMLNGLELYNQEHNNTYPGESAPGLVNMGYIYYEMFKSADGTFTKNDYGENVGDLETLLAPYFDISSVFSNLKTDEFLIYYWDPDSMCINQTTTPRVMVLFAATQPNDGIPNYFYIASGDEYPDYNCLSI